MLNNNPLYNLSTSESKPSLNRKRALGIYYTPPEAALIMARWAITHHTNKVLEPSFGGCAMLTAAVTVYESLGTQNPSSQLYGFDVDNKAFEYLARMNLKNENGHFQKKDFLKSSANDIRVDAVLANPPFVSYHRLNNAQRILTNKLRQRYLPELPKLASLWVYFILHSMAFLRNGGRMAFVLPNAIGHADYAQPLLSFLQTRFKDIQLIHVSEQLFIQEGASERITLLLMKDYYCDDTHHPSNLHHSYVSSINELASLMSNTETKKFNLSIKDSAQIALDNLNEKLTQLGSIANVKIGEVVGDIKFFVRSIPQWQALGISKRDLVPILTKSTQLIGLDAPSATHENLVSFLLHTNRKRVKAITEYLDSYPIESLQNNKTLLNRPQWYECSYETNADAFIGSITHDYPRISLNQGLISASNAFYKIILTGSLEAKRWLPLLSLSTPTRLSAEILGRVRGSGGIKLEPSDVRKLSIPTVFPNISDEDFNSLRNAINKLVISKEFDAANQIVDSELYIKTGLVDANTMSKLRTLRLELTSLRK
ncbi:MAG: SAM-dependent methyltransferase [Burkholderiaceae bacterium]|nr:SAM-dependent methyltransferase [Burkholderiaceae bacterium]